MAYALRYYKEIPQKDGGIVRLEIHKKDDTAGAVEIGAVVRSLYLEIQGQQGDIDTPIVKTSLSMTFVDAQDIENGKKNGFWEEFYTPDAVMWKVVLKARDAKETSFRDIWSGYVTPDSFSESLTYRGDVTIIARDNIGHLQDFPFDAVGDDDGMISLHDLVSTAWDKIESPMTLWIPNGNWLYGDGMIGYNTLMNVSAFEGMNWYEAVEKALYGYGLVMRYRGNNAVDVCTLRDMPKYGTSSEDSVAHLEPIFVTGAQRELVPAVKRIEERVSYEHEDSRQVPQVQASDYTGDIEQTDLQTSSGVRFTVYDWNISNRTPGLGWVNAPSPIYFNPNGYDIVELEDSKDNEFMWLSSSAYLGSFNRYAEYSQWMSASKLSVELSFGPTYRLANGVLTLIGDSARMPERVAIGVYVDDTYEERWLNADGEWVSTEQMLTIPLEQGKMSLPLPVDAFTGRVLVGVRIYYLAALTWDLDAYTPLYSLTFREEAILMATNTVNTVYNDKNNVILKRDPKIAPAYDKVALPAVIKNGIFRRSSNTVLPTKLWKWNNTGSAQQMAVWNHLQLLSYYAKPFNLISGTIVNADITRMARIYTWKGDEHILTSGRFNFLNGHIEGAMLRGFYRYESLWSEVEGSGDVPATEASSTNSVESGSGASSNAPTYTSTTNVNVGGGGSATNLSELLDVDLTGLTAKSVLYYDGEKWVDKNLQDLLGWYIDPDTWVLTTDKDVRIKGNLIVEKDSASGGTSDATTNIGTVDHIIVSGKPYYPDNAGVVDLTEAFEGLQVDIDLSGYLKTTDIAAWAKASTKPTYTKAEVGLENVDNTADSAKSVLYAATAGSAPASDVYAWAKKSSLAVADVPDLSSKYLSVNGGIIGGDLEISGLAKVSGKNQDVMWQCYGGQYNLGFGIGSGNINRGIYDFTNESWLIYRASGTNVYLPSGNVGIGRHDASYKLDVSGTGRFTGTLTASDILTNYLSFGTTDHAIYKGTAYNSVLAATDIAYYATKHHFATGTDYAKTLVISRDGVVVSVPFTAEGDVVINGNLIVKGDSASGGSAGSNTAYLPLTGGTIKNGATRNPLTIDTTGVGSYLVFSSNGSANGYVGCNTNLKCTFLEYSQGGFTYSMYVTPSGVGVNTNTPAAPLQIRPYGSVYGVAIGADGNSIDATYDNSVTGNLYINHVATGNVYLCTGGGKVGVGTNSPSYKLHVNGNFYATSVSQGSDIRFKNRKCDYALDLHSIANAPLFAFTWNDRDDPDLHLGTSAQYWESIVPQLVSGTDFKALDYSTLGVAMGISLAKKTLNHEERIKALESENKALKEQLSELYNGTVC